MRLIHTATGEEAEVGDLVTSFRDENAIIKHFVPPHKPSSSGHVSITYLDRKTMPGYNYVGVWGLEWIEREDRGDWPSKDSCCDGEGNRKCRSVTHCERYGKCEPS